MSPTQLEIKARALQRLVKEEGYYQQELKEQTELVEKLKKDKDLDPYDLKKQEEVQKDTEKLLPTLYQKIREFKENLEQFLESYQGSESVEGAKSAIDSANELLKTRDN
ncbi:hypothetical protein HG536_0A08150 [Torulaspora globosa]|uniref:Tubulin-specific chaperone A n=1 Tax=Torulaspora globosa TaxID=48254 RepID=A0A7G3ZBW4_9SACH|nr:uncharacterized protein HG536_0A08150 [Torulaspora globosa]QLL31000.1 hypothetical protein HG536_0A08150 [Torulaspora globosa]